MAIQPELFLRKTILDEYEEETIQIEISDLIQFLKDKPGVWWNAYSQKYGVMIREFPYEARNGFFIDVERRVCTHRFESKGIVRRDTILEEEAYRSIVPPAYRPKWFDPKDAIRTYAVLISDIEPLEQDVPVEKFGLFNSWGKVSSRDQFHHPRLIKPTWDKMKEKLGINCRL